MSPWTTSEPLLPEWLFAPKREESLPHQRSSRRDDRAAGRGNFRGLGRPIKGVVVPGEAAIQSMVGQGVPQHVADGSADLFSLITEGKVAALQHEWQTTGKKDFEEYTTRPQITTEQWFKTNAGAFTKH